MINNKKENITIIMCTYNLKSFENMHGLNKYSDFNGIRTHDLCNTGVVLYQLSYQANWELVIL